jgi:hypothetical protein
MMKFQNKKNKSTQYAIGGTVAVIMLALWIGLPLMSGSSLDSSVSAGNPFRSKVADIGMLGSDISSEAGAPGSPLSGEMINNPATSGENIASSLFQSGPLEEETAAAAATADASASAPAAPSPSGSAGAPSAGAPRGGKVSPINSLTGGNSNTMTTGGMHNKFFGSGSQKSEFAPTTKADLKAPTVDKKSSLVAMLGDSSQKSLAAAKTGNMDQAKGGAASAFGSSAKGPSGENLDGSMEQSAALSGLQMGQTAQDLKKNDPSLNKNKITPPSKPEDATDENEEMKQQIKMMIIKMVLQMALGAVFGPVAGAAAGAV